MPYFKDADEVYEFIGQLFKDLAGLVEEEVAALREAAESGTMAPAN